MRLDSILIMLIVFSSLIFCDSNRTTMERQKTNESVGLLEEMVKQKQESTLDAYMCHPDSAKRHWKQANKERKLFLIKRFERIYDFKYEHCRLFNIQDTLNKLMFQEFVTDNNYLSDSVEKLFLQKICCSNEDKLVVYWNDTTLGLNLNKLTPQAEKRYQKLMNFLKVSKFRWPKDWSNKDSINEIISNHEKFW